MPVRLLLLLVVSLALSACSLPFTTQPTATLAPTLAPTEEPTTAPTATPRPAPTEAPAPQPTAAPRSTPTTEPAGALRPSECLFDVPTGYEVECGFLTVPEDRTANAGRTIELAVAVFKSTSPNPRPDPIVYLEGGPGGHALQAIPLTFEDYFAPFLAERDFIMFDQRGTGYSNPSLACDEYTRLAYDNLDDDLTIDEANQQFVDAILACHSRLESQGINLAAYNSIASAADLADLRTALGYDEWNLYGISYGTRLALTTMREQPEGIRSVILDSTRSLQSSETSTPGDVNRALEQLFDGCTQDADCNSAFPNLRETFYTLVDQLNAKPATGEATNPFTRKTHNILIDGDTLIGLTAQALYSTDIIPQLPKAIAAASKGADYSLLIRLALNSALQNEYVSYGMFYSVRCNEEIPFDTPGALAAADDSFPQLRGVFDLASYSEICDAWGAGTAPAVENQPVASDLPTLILAGQYDPATPPEDGRAASQTLSQSYFFEFPGLGHGVSVDGGCPLSITLTFLDNPTARPDDTCISAMGGPAFVGTGAALKLVPLTSQTFGFTSLVPEGWEEVSPGIHARNSSSDIAILQFALPLSPDETLARLSQQLNLVGDTDPVGERETDQLTWSLYELTLQGLPADLALADGDGQTFVVMLISDAIERESLYDGLFLPVLDAFTPST